MCTGRGIALQHVTFVTLPDISTARLRSTMWKVMFSVCPPGGLFAAHSEFTDSQVPGWPFCYSLGIVKWAFGLLLKGFLVYYLFVVVISVL